MEDSNDFESYKNLIEKEKAEEELFESIYGHSLNNCLLNFNNFSDSSLKINKNICIVGQKDSYKSKFIRTLISHIIYNFFIGQKDAPRIFIFFSVKDIIDPNHFISLAEDYFLKMNPLNPISDKTKFDNEKARFLKYFKSCISLILISTFNDVKSVLEELQKNDKEKDNSNLIGFKPHNYNNNVYSNFNNYDNNSNQKVNCYC